MHNIIFTSLKKFSDPRGEVRRVMRGTDPGYFGFEEVYISTINENRIKGWKRHNEMTLNLVPVFGLIKVAVAECVSAKKIQDYGIYELSIENYGRLTIPPGYWVAFRAVGQNSGLLNFANRPHNPDETDIVEYDESRLAVDWMIK